ncbi:MAG: hypothetical protein M3264_13360 [Thermoproteota archaeon]|nr:hypothetical protein [Thermoproteota archaeon]
MNWSRGGGEQQKANTTQQRCLCQHRGLTLVVAKTHSILDRVSYHGPQYWSVT